MKRTERKISAIDVRNVSKVFTTRSREHVMALREVSLTVHEGEFVVLLGPSGCGKTTLLRMMGRLEEPTVGRIDSYSAKNGAEGESSIGFVFQEATLMPWRTTGGNVALPLELAGVPRRERLSRVRAALELVQLSGTEDKFPQQLSGGMRQRVSIARALVHESDVLLMDEPFGALDAQTRDLMNVELQRIWLDTKKTVVFVTHSVAESVFLADRVVMLGTKPGHVHAITEIDLPRPRTMEMVETEKFRGFAATLRQQLSDVQAANLRTSA